MSDFYVVWNPMSGPPTCRHSDREGAQREAERLALRCPGQEIFDRGRLAEADDIENAARTEIAAAKRQRSWAA